MTIDQIKAVISAKEGYQVGPLNICENFEKDGTTPTGYVDHWDNDHRVRICMAREIYDNIVEGKKAKVEYDKLALKAVQLEEAKPKADGTVRAAYKRYVVITPGDVLGTL